ncbi:MAG TPA: hypothetical protein VK590_06695, partial [Saprospiraceae bacterium]|nr:hypothetical protein [Saprospiraceae bacterium]
MKPQFRILIIGFFFLSIPFVKSTILVPFRHLGELTQFADQVLYVEAVGGQFDINLDEKHEYFPVKVISTIKGNAQIDDFIKIRSYHTLINEMESKIWGDINLKEHVKYLVFLKQSNIIGDYQAIGLSYYVFEEKIIDGEPYLIPCDESRYIHLNERPDGFPAEPLTDYKRDDLLKYLKLYTINGNHWYGKMAIPDLKIEKKIEDIQLRTEPPSWCTFLFVSEPWSRWTGFPASPLPVKYQSTGDIDCPTSITKTQAAIPVLSSAYAGINLTDGSSFSGYTPNCMGGSAYQGNFISFCNSTLGGVRNVAIIYNDPCSEVPDLSSCSGTLAIGGSYTTGGTNMYQGKTWNTAGYGFVIVNNGVGACYCSSSFTIMLEHEITHTLGIGHISSGAGVANMNPSCCNTISSLDIACLEYSYSS